jgi:ferritin
MGEICVEIRVGSATEIECEKLNEWRVRERRRSNELLSEIVKNINSKTDQGKELCVTDCSLKVQKKLTVSIPLRE